MPNEPFIATGRTSQKSQNSFPALCTKLQKEIDEATNEDDRKAAEYALMVINGAHAPGDRRKFLQLSLNDRANFRQDIMQRHQEKTEELTIIQVTIDNGAEAPENFDKLVKSCRLLQRAVTAIESLRRAAIETNRFNDEQRAAFPAQHAARKFSVRRTGKQPTI